MKVKGHLQVLQTEIEAYIKDMRNTEVILVVANACFFVICAVILFTLKFVVFASWYLWYMNLLTFTNCCIFSYFVARLNYTLSVRLLSNNFVISFSATESTCLVSKQPYLLMDMLHPQHTGCLFCHQMQFHWWSPLLKTHRYYFRGCHQTVIIIFS